MTDVHDVCEALLAGVDAEGDIVDDALAEPFSPLARTLASWPIREEHTSIESGPTVQVDFEVDLLYIADDRGEHEARQRKPSVTAELRAKKLVITEWIRADQTLGDTVAYAHVSGVDWDAERRFTRRGFVVRVAGFFEQD